MIYHHDITKHTHREYFQVAAPDPEELRAILSAGENAPTAHGIRHQRLILVRDDNQLRKLCLCTRYARVAPAAIVAGYDKRARGANPDIDRERGDAGMRADMRVAISRMVLAAYHLCLGVNIIRDFDLLLLRMLLTLPTEMTPVALLYVGYPLRCGCGNIPARISGQPEDQAELQAGSRNTKPVS